jgi:histidinol-phosphate aminotransferase
VLVEQLSKLAFVEKIYPSEANFLLVKTLDANTIYNYLVGKKIVVRNRHSVVANCLRISVGKPEENQKLIQTLKQL